MTKPIDEFRAELHELRAKGKTHRDSLIQFRMDLSKMRDAILNEIVQVDKALELLK